MEHNNGTYYQKHFYIVLLAFRIGYKLHYEDNIMTNDL